MLLFQLLINIHVFVIPISVRFKTATTKSQPQFICRIMGFESNETAAKSCPSHKVQGDYLRKEMQANNFCSLEIFILTEHKGQNFATSTR